MAQSQRRWDVVYGQVDLQTHTTVQKFAAQNVNWKTALMVKRNHKRIVSMKICPTKLAPDARESGAKIVSSKSKRSVKSARG